MSFDTDWDVEKYKSDYESEEHWKLRREFMLAHKTKFSEDRLVCLAQLFFNVEFLGCKYPEATMKLVEELSRDIAADHRDQQKTKLQRTFVKASDAAGAKVKVLKRRNENPPAGFETREDKHLKFQKEGERKCTEYSFDNVIHSSGFTTDTVGNRFQLTPSSYSSNVKGNFSGNAANSGCADGIQSQNPSNRSVGFTSSSDSGNIKGRITIDEIKRTSGPFGNIVVFVRNDDHPYTSLVRTARQWNKQISSKITREGLLWSVEIRFNNIPLSSYKDPDKVTARRMASQIGLDVLMSRYFTVKIKLKFSGGDEVVQACQKQNTEDVEIPSVSSANDGNDEVANGMDTLTIAEIDKSENPEQLSNKSPIDGNDVAKDCFDTPLDDGNVGLKLLKMMGWSGGGLGKNKQGIIEPIKPEGLIKSRAGFGCNVKNTNLSANIKPKKKRKRGARAEEEEDPSLEEELAPIKQIIRDYKFSDSYHDLVFSPDFTKEQRAALHKYAQKLRLKSKSYGGKNEENRHLVLSKKIDNWTIIEGLASNVDQFYNKYELLRPQFK